MKYTSLTAEIADLECRNRELDNIIGPFKEQLIQFEVEREQLMSKTESTEKELKALALEHAKALGHQNHKQKIRHVVNLTEQIAEQKKVREVHLTPYFIFCIALRRSILIGRVKVARWCFIS